MFHNVNNELFRTVSKSTSSSSSSFDDVISSSATKSTASDITTDDIYGLCNGSAQRKETPISQFASRVLEFSSQYGSDNSISYTACNITGRPSKYPNYGDFPETFAMVSDFEFTITSGYIFALEPKPNQLDYNVFLFLLQRTYGKWWDMAPSRVTDIMPQTIHDNIPQDFIGN